MTNDKLLYHLLYSFIENLSVEAQITLLENPDLYWVKFCDKAKKLEDEFEEVLYLMRNIVLEIHRKDKLKCQYCRIEQGLLVRSPVEPHHLCKLHRQEYETSFEDRTLKQMHPALSELRGIEGMSCSAPRQSNG